MHEPQTNIAPDADATSADPAVRAAAILAERFKHTQGVGRLKAEHALPPSDPAREAAQIERLERLAREADLDPAFARKFLNFVISEVIRHHEQLQK